MSTDLRPEISSIIERIRYELEEIEKLAKEKGFSIKTEINYNCEWAVIRIITKKYGLDINMFNFNYGNFCSHMYHLKTNPNQWNEYTLEHFKKEEYRQVMVTLDNIDWIKAQKDNWYHIKFTYRGGYGNFYRVFKVVLGQDFRFEQEFEKERTVKEFANGNFILKFTMEEVEKINTYIQEAKEYIEKH